MDVRSILGIKNTGLSMPAPGDTVKVTLKIKEGERERTQVFQGVVIGISKTDSGPNFTVRRVSYSIGVERTFFFQSPLVEKVEVIRQGKVRRAKIYYLRELSGKASRLKERARTTLGVDLKTVSTETEEEQPAAEAAAGEQVTENIAEQPVATDSNPKTKT